MYLHVEPPRCSCATMLLLNIPRLAEKQNSSLCFAKLWWSKPTRPTTLQDKVARSLRLLIPPRPLRPGACNPSYLLLNCNNEIRPWSRDAHRETDLPNQSRHQPRRSHPLTLQTAVKSPPGARPRGRASLRARDSSLRAEGRTHDSAGALARRSSPSVRR